MSANGQGRNKFVKLACWVIAVAAMAAACSSNPATTNAGSTGQDADEQVIVIISRSEMADSGIIADANPDDHRTARKLELLLQYNPVTGLDLNTQLQDIDNQDYLTDWIEIEHAGHLTMDITVAENICDTASDYRCLVAVITYEPCQPAAACAHHKISELTLAIANRTPNDVTGVIVHSFNPDISPELMYEHVDLAAANLTEAGFKLDINTKASLHQTADSLSKKQALEAVFTRQTEIILGPETERPADAEEIDNALVDTILDIYFTAVAELQSQRSGSV